jgi:hypothetical protein
MRPAVIELLAMSHPFVVLFGFGLAAGLPAYYIAIKRRAAASLRALMAERFSPLPCPIPELRTPHGPVTFREAYADKSGSGLVLVLGYWRRSRTAYNLVAGLFKPGGKLDSRGAERDGQQVLVAANVEGGDLVIWKGLPSRDSVLTHLQSVR